MSSYPLIILTSIQLHYGPFMSQPLFSTATKIIFYIFSQEQESCGPEKDYATNIEAVWVI